MRSFARIKLGISLPGTSASQEMARRGIEARVAELLRFGFNRVLFLWISPALAEGQLPVLDRYAALIRNLPRGLVSRGGHPQPR